MCDLEPLARGTSVPPSQRAFEGCPGQPGRTERTVGEVKGIVAKGHMQGLEVGGAAEDGLEGWVYGNQSGAPSMEES